jgi:hypothetical protein
VAFTVAPLHNLSLPAGSRIPFGSKFAILDVPDWLRTDKGILADISRDDRMATLACRQALVSEYEAGSYYSGAEFPARAGAGRDGGKFAPQFRSRTKAVLGGFSQATLHKPHQRRRHLRIQAGQRLRLFQQNRCLHVNGAFAPEGAPSGGHLIEHRSEREMI